MIGKVSDQQEISCLEGPCVRPSPRPPVSHLATNHSPTRTVSHLPERGALIFSKNPKSQRKSLSFLPKTSSDVQKRGWGGGGERRAATMTIALGGQGLGPLGKKGNSNVSEICLSTLVFPCGLLLGLSSSIRARTHHHIRPAPHLDLPSLPRAGRNRGALSSLSKGQPRPRAGFSLAEGPASLLAGFSS